MVVMRMHRALKVAAGVAAAGVVGFAGVLLGGCQSGSGGSGGAERTARIESVSLAGASGATLHVRGLSCPLCATNIDKGMRALPGVGGAEVDLGAGTVELTFVPGARPSAKQIDRAVRDSGFTLVGIDRRD